jgi:predicted nucleic acid-binding protein
LGRRTLYFLDRNILLYSISRDPGETAKRERAVELLDSAEAALSVQVLQEFYVQTTRSNRPDAVAHEIAAGLIRTWTRFKSPGNRSWNLGCCAGD